MDTLRYVQGCEILSVVIWDVKATGLEGVKFSLLVRDSTRFLQFWKFPASHLAEPQEQTELSIRSNLTTTRLVCTHRLTDAAGQRTNHALHSTGPIQNRIDPRENRPRLSEACPRPYHVTLTFQSGFLKGRFHAVRDTVRAYRGRQGFDIQQRHHADLPLIHVPLGRSQDPSRLRLHTQRQPHPTST